MSQSVKDLLAVLESKNCRQEDKCSTYVDLASKVHKDNVELNISELRAHSPRLLKVSARDLSNEDEVTVKNVLEVLAFYLQDEQIGSLQKTDSSSILHALLKCMKRTKSTDVMKQSLFCLAVQKFHIDVVRSEFSAVLEHVEEAASKLKAQSLLNSEELTNVFIKLDDQCKSGMTSAVFRWGRLVFPGLASTSASVQDKSLQLLQKYAHELKASAEMRKYVIKAITSGLANSLKCLVVKCEEHVLRAWTLIVIVAGKELHKGPSINLLLEIIEIGFKGSPQARCLAFVAWKTLVDNFALDQAIISDPKRIKLIMMVLKVDNAKTEAIALEKLQTWWHFVTSVGPKLSANFEQIIVPLLQFCVGSGKFSSSGLTQSPLLALKSPMHKLPLSLGSGKSINPQLPVFPALQILGMEVVARILAKSGKQDAGGKVTWSLAKIPQEVLAGSNSFVKHAPNLLFTTQELLRNVGHDVEGALIVYVWTNFVNHLRTAMESPAKIDCRDVYSSFLSVLHTVVQNQMLDGAMLVKLIEISSSFPQKVLASTAYNITGGQTVRNCTSSSQACPALLLSEMLLTPCVMSGASVNDSYVKLFSSLIGAGASNVQGALLFLQSVTGLLGTQAGLCHSAEALWRMWSVIAHTLQDNVNVTNEVNQGDSLEYNFDCVNAVLLFPVKNQLPSKLSQTVCKALLKLWKEIYHSFARLSALVATAEANTCLEEFCGKLLQTWLPEFKDPVFLEFLTSICQKTLDCVDFSAMSTSQQQSGLTLSPSKWARRRHKPLGNLHSFVHLVSIIQQEANVHITGTESLEYQQKQNYASFVVFIAHGLVETYTKLFSHITTNTVITTTLSVLAEPMSQLFVNNSKSGLKLFVPSFMTKLEKLWQEVSQCITGRYNGQYDTEFLEYVSPLLETTFLHSKRTIKNQTLTMWNTTFSKSTSLTYPEKLKPVLMKVKEKTNIILPGWISQEAGVVAETPFSEMSMGESQQAPPPCLPGMPSPKRQRGSMLHRDLSPSRKTSPSAKSPAKAISPKDAKKLFSSMWSRMAVDSMKEEEFVVINSPATRKKMVLTEHQKEVMKEKRILPAMYNNLELSQDVSLMSQFAGDNTQQSSQSSQSVIVVSSGDTQDKDKNSKNDLDMSEKSELSGFTVPMATRRRKSVRIQELQSVSEPSEGDLSEKSNEKHGSASEAKTKVVTTYLEKQVSAVNKTQDEVDVRAENFSEEDVVKSSIETDEDLSKNVVSEKSANQTDVSDSSINNDAPFVMFRNKESPESKSISLSQDSGKPELRRVSLRKVHSQNDMTGSQSAKQENETNKKAPRRVPLKKISDHQNEQAKDGTEKLPTKQEKSSPASNLDQWIVKGNPTKSSDGKTSGAGAVNSPSFALVVESDTPPDEETEETHTLVEDTQSPFKLSAKRQIAREQDKSIAETPTKSDTSPPVLRSVRKLFVDKVSGEDDKTVGEAEVGSSGKPPSSDADPEVTSSQGFETSLKETKNQKEQDRLTAFGFSLPEEEEDSEKVPEKADAAPGGSKQINSATESESLFPCTGEEVQKFSLEMMPTLASQLHSDGKDFGSQSPKSSSEESGKESNKSGETVDRVPSSSESDFNPVVPTIEDESEKAALPNRRKKAVPKKYSPMKRPRRATRNKLVEKKCPCCASSPRRCKHKDRKPVTSTVQEEADDVSHTPSKHQPSSTEEEKSKSGHQSENSSEKRSDVTNSKEGPDGEMTHLKPIELSPEVVGEVTPDMKSPSNFTPSRRHSSVKRSRSCAVTSQEVKSKQKDPKKTSLDFSSSLKKGDKVSPIKNAIVDEYADLEIKKRKLSGPSATGNKKRIISPRQRTGQPRHMLRTRGKIGRKLSPSSSAPPLKSRKISEPKQRNKGGIKMRKTIEKVAAEESDEDEDNVPLSQISLKTVKQCDVDEVTDSVDEVVAPSIEPVTDDMEETGLSEITEVITRQEEEQKIDDNQVVDTESECNPPSPFMDHSYADSQDHIQPGQQMLSLESESSGEGEPTSKNCEPSGLEDIAEEPASSNRVNDTEDESHSEPLRVDAQSDIAEMSEPLSPVIADKSAVDATSIPESEEMHEEKSIPSSDSIDHVETDVSEEDKKLHQGEDADMPQDVVNQNDAKSNPEASTTDNSEADNSDKENASTKSADAKMDTESEAEASCCNDSSKKESEKVDEAVSVEAEEQQSNEVTGEAASAAAGTPDTERVLLHDWSPSKSPSSSILKKFDQGTPPSSKSRRVSFADPVVSGKSPVREKYQSESAQSSPLTPCDSPGRRSFIMRKNLGRLSGYKRRLESSLRKDPSLARLSRYNQSPSGSPLSQSPYRATPSPLSQSSYRATLESQLDSTKPIFPDLVDCQKDLDNILPQLTSSLWYRGLCQMMKGRNLNTIGDLCALTEVQVNQLPIRNPKVETVRMVLSGFMAQHGLQKAPVVEVDSGSPDRTLAKGATIGEVVTPSSIADEGIKVRPGDDAALESISPIKDAEASRSSPRKMLVFDMDEGNALAHLKELAEHKDSLGLKEMNNRELFEMHQTLNSLFGVLVEEMKSREPSS
ncbi:telomere-associated protein RIF1 isoform X1 [Aplysia californica]|uniref:Telomere-associated protein RIF1 isoform X1 n=1 Tax=Aplysia californica TaxID=6500 RepID=A0ABM0JXN4_APLCA|nr:telomere-associated protein RIF1 isoform X1 [Aplysia californica]